MLRHATALALMIAALVAIVPPAQAGYEYPASHPWVKKWSKRDRSIWPANRVVARIFHVSEGTLDELVGAEGGNINPGRLHNSLCTGAQPGWNTQGSYAFGPYQFMLSSKPACSRAWGTFGAYDDSAFQYVKRLGYPVPYRFKTPASNVGQAVVAAYIVRIGQVCVHWSASLSYC